MEIPGLVWLKYNSENNHELWLGRRNYADRPILNWRTERRSKLSGEEGEEKDGEPFWDQGLKRYTEISTIKQVHGYIKVWTGTQRYQGLNRYTEISRFEQVHGDIKVWTGTRRYQGLIRYTEISRFDQIHWYIKV